METLRLMPPCEISIGTGFVEICMSLSYWRHGIYKSLFRFWIMGNVVFERKRLFSLVIKILKPQFVWIYRIMLGNVINSKHIKPKKCVWKYNTPTTFKNLHLKSHLTYIKVVLFYLFFSIKSSFVSSLLPVWIVLLFFIYLI